MKNFLWKIHRWLGLFLAPFFALILISGAILAFKPILAPQLAGTAVGSHAASLLQAVEAADAAGAQMQSLALDKNGQVFWTTGGKNAPLQAFALSDGSFVREGGISPKLYRFAKDLHEELLLDVDVVIEIAAYALCVMILIGLVFMMRPRLQKRLMAWHNALGVLLLPAWLLLPLTGVLMTLDLGKPDLDGLSKDGPPVAAIVRQLAQQNQLPNLVAIDSLKGRTVIRLAAGNGVQSVQMDEAGQLVPVQTATYWVKELHEGTWAGNASGWLNFALAAGLLLFLISGMYSWLSRRLQRRSAAQPTPPVGGSKARFLVAYASQTGTARRLAESAARHLNSNHLPAQCVSMAGIHAPNLTDYECCLLICATTGDGALPDEAIRLAKELDTATLPTARYALLALGDKNFTHFCGGGRKLAELLGKTGAKSVLPLRMVDGAPEQDWSEWMTQLGGIYGFAPPQQVQNADTPLSAVLINKQRLDCPEYSHREAWTFTFKLPDAIEFNGGDLLLLTPPDAKTARHYSIGSDSADGSTVRLTVGLHRFTTEDGTVRDGRASSWLIRALNVGDTVAAVLRRHPSFNLPDDDTPVVMIAVGTGIAPMVGFLPKLARHKRPAWLFFGNAHRDGNDFYREEWEQALNNGSLTHMNKVFDNEGHGFVQDEMLRHGAELYHWLQQQNARVYVCGRADTIGRGCEAALMQIYREYARASEAEAAAWLDQLKTAGRLRMDMFG